MSLRGGTTRFAARRAKQSYARIEPAGDCYAHLRQAQVRSQ